MAEFVLYHHPQSRGRIARWMLEELGVPYRLALVGFNDPAPGAAAVGMGDAGFAAVTQMRKVPALVHGETVVTEAAAICAYLADAAPAAGLAPPPAERGAYYRWLFFAAGPFEQAITSAAMGWAAPPERERMLGFGSLPRVLDALEGWLGAREYITHDRFTAADVYVGSALGYGMMVGSVPKRPAFETYHARLAARPAALRASALDDALAAEGKV
ncbi:glutathione S-transferase N-terminal domain-containing protein [Frigidibacter sp. MR17.14]|uniref:glutathione S-transferase family protein n=1 Tax=Frigidibacter sp. MR17.14 TaxID=3126509 RepID=UPI00301317A9